MKSRKKNEVLIRKWYSFIHKIVDFVDVESVILSNGFDKELKTFSFLDNVSEVTLVDDRIAKLLNLQEKKERLNLRWSNEVTCIERSSERVSPLIFEFDKKESFTLMNARTVKTLSLPTQFSASAGLQCVAHLQGLSIAEYNEAKPEVLIGLDKYQLMITQDTIEGKWN